MNTPTGYSALDLVGFTDRGDYSSSETYVKNDLVHYLGDIWRVKLDDITGQTPSEGTYYTIFIEGIPDKAYKTDDTTENTLASDDVLPFYDTSASAKRKMPVQKFAEQLISNPNLLDNPWFTVNQRGQSSYSNGGTSGAKYTLDRWKIDSYSNLDVSVNNDGSITLTNPSANENQQFIQVVEDSIIENGKTYTLSLDVVDYTNTVKFNLSGVSSPYPPIVSSKIVNQTGINSKTGTKGSETNTWKVCIILGANASVTLRAVKLELGSVSTLAMDTAPNYATELLKCQRYYVRFKNSDNGVPLAFGYLFQGNSRVTCPLSVPMRAKPSFKFTTSGSGGPTFTLASGDFATNISNFTIDTDDTHQRIIFLYPNITSNTTELAVLRLNVGVLLELSADL